MIRKFDLPPKIQYITTCHVHFFVVSHLLYITKEIFINAQDVAVVGALEDTELVIASNVVAFAAVVAAAALATVVFNNMK